MKLFLINVARLREQSERKPGRHLQNLTRITRFALIRATNQLRFFPALLLLLCSFSYAAVDFQPLPVNQVYQISAQAKDHQTIVVSWKIAPGYALYRSRMHFRPANPKQTRLAQPLLPEGVAKYNKELGDYQVYLNQVHIIVPVIKSQDNQLNLVVNYQGCAEQGFCYPPQQKSFHINLKGNYGETLKASSTVAPVQTPDSFFTRLLQHDNDILMALSFISFGILIAFTPCCLPMIPIISSIVIGPGKHSLWRGFTLSLSYVIGMSITYAFVGVIFAEIGANVQTLLQGSFFIIVLSILFLLMALSMFGLFTIQLPKRWQAKLSDTSNHQRRGSYIGTFVMGILATLILSPCVTPPLVGVLGFITSTGDLWLGASALFCLGFGIGLPLIVIGTFGPKCLPKAGGWMNAVKYVLGVLLIAVTISLLQRIIPASISMLLWAALALGCAWFMRAFESAKTVAQKLRKILAVLLFIYAIILLVAAYLGNDNPLNPLPAQQRVQSLLKFQVVKGENQTRMAINKAAYEHKPVMLDFYADWCVSCKEMDHYTFSNPAVAAALKGYVLLRADVTDNDHIDKALERYFGVVAPPTILFFGPNGQPVPNSRIIGEMSANAFLAHMKKL